MDNYKEIFNESCVLISMPSLFGFAIFPDDGDKLVLFGWAFIAILVVNVAVNVIYAFYYSVIEKLISYLKKKGFFKMYCKCFEKAKTFPLQQSESHLMETIATSHIFNLNLLRHDRSSSSDSNKQNNFEYSLKEPAKLYEERPKPKLIRIENFENDSFPYDMEQENRRKSDLKNQTISNLLNQSRVSR